MAEPDLRRRRRLFAYCPRCAKRYVRARPEWVTCLECEVNPQWTPVVAGEFIARAMRMFPGSVELVAPGPEEQLELDEAA
jgi:hypothetical protein